MSTPQTLDALKAQREQILPLIDALIAALEAAQQEIADLKRGGVVVPELTGEDIDTGWNAYVDKCPDFQHGEDDAEWLVEIYSAGLRYAERLIASRLRHIPADRELREGEARIGMNELRMLRDFAGRRMSEREHDRLEAVRDAHEDALRAQPTQEPTP